jgi:hypothetical protein
METSMKRLLPISLLLGTLLAACPAPPAIVPPDPPVGPEPIEIPVIPNVKPNTQLNLHTMVVIGTENLFLSHLPLYGAPHDYQIILKVELDPISKAALLDDQQTTGAKLYTIFPPPITLISLADALRSGNTFELDGSTIARGQIEDDAPRIIFNAKFTVTKALHFRQLNSNDADPAASKYLLFGANDENFVAHLIAGAPNFDHILEVTAPAGKVVDFVAQEIDIPAQAPDALLNENQTFSAELFGETIQLTTGAETYVEFDDLSQ